LDLSVGSGHTFRMVACCDRLSSVPFLGDTILRLGGVNLNEPLPFKDETLNGIPSGRMIDETLAVRAFLKLSRTATISGPSPWSQF